MTHHKDQTVLTGTSRRSIAPPPGTRMMGFANRDEVHGCTGVHDDVVVSAVWLEQAEPVVILAYDFCFLRKFDVDRIKAQLGARFDVLPRQVLINTSHTHGSAAFSPWGDGGLDPCDPLYQQFVERVTIEAVAEAKQSARPASVWVGAGTTDVPVNRRRIIDGKLSSFGQPYPDGPVYDRLPVCVFKDTSDQPIAVLFSVAAHPSATTNFEVSADYCGYARQAIDEALGGPVSVFLQGCGGDAKQRANADWDRGWIVNDWERIKASGRSAGVSALETIESGLEQIEPDLASVLDEVMLPLAEPPSKEELQAIAAQHHPGDAPSWPMYHAWWAHRELQRREKYGEPERTYPLRLQGLRLSHNAFVVAIEGEPFAGLGHLVDRVFEDVADARWTMPLGYTNGDGMYLPLAADLPLGGYEVESYWEFGVPASLAEGVDLTLNKPLQNLASTFRSRVPS